MRWEALFADLEAQLAAQADDPAHAAELVRGEVAGVHLLDRLRAAEGVVLQLRLRSGTSVSGRVLDVGADWLLVQDAAARVLVPVGAVSVVGGLSRAVAPPAGMVERRLRLGVALRALARERTAVFVEVSGHRLHGTIDRVAADHVDLAEHPPGELRRAREVRGVVTLPLAALVSLRSSGPAL